MSCHAAMQPCTTTSIRRYRYLGNQAGRSIPTFPWIPGSAAVVAGSGCGCLTLWLRLSTVRQRFFKTCTNCIELHCII